MQSETEFHTISILRYTSRLLKLNAFTKKIHPNHLSANAKKKRVNQSFRIIQLQGLLRATVFFGSAKTEKKTAFVFCFFY